MAKARVTTKTKKKQWVPILAPKIFSNKPLGDTYALEPKIAVGRTLLYNLKELTGNMKDQNVYITFRIRSWNNDNLATEIIGYQITPGMVKRIIRRNTSRVDGVMNAKTSDGKNIQLKVVIQTLHRAQKSTRTQLLKDATKRIVEDLAKLNYGNLLDKLISHKLQSDMKKSLNVIFPIKNFEVKSMKLLLDKKASTSEEELEQEEPVELVEKAEEVVVKEPSQEVTAIEKEEPQPVETEA